MFIFAKKQKLIIKEGYYACIYIHRTWKIRSVGQAKARIEGLSRRYCPRDTWYSICTSDLHIKHGSVPRAVPGITVGHEMVGVVEQVGSRVTSVKPGDRVTVNVETFCGECFFCQHGYVNNCTDVNGGWALGCRIDGGQAEYVREVLSIPFVVVCLTLAIRN